MGDQRSAMIGNSHEVRVKERSFCGFLVAVIALYIIDESSHY